MTSIREMKERGYIPQTTFIKMITAGAFSLGKIILTNISDLKNLRDFNIDTNFYVRPNRKFVLPKYEKSMKFCNSDEKYLRPTLYCNSHDPKIIAIANKLGAFKKSDYEFAESAFEFSKRNLTLEILVLDEVDDTLNRGTGTCLHINSVFAALCRAAGIKARYNLFAAIESQSMYDDVYDPMMRRWYDALGYFSIEGDIEVYVDGKWVKSHAGPTPERQAAMGCPITRFGESSIGMWFDAIPGTMMKSESLPYGVGFLSKILMKIAPSTVNSINLNIHKQIEKGKGILGEVGEDVYDRQTREKFRLKVPKIALKKDKNIIFNTD